MAEPKAKDPKEWDIGDVQQWLEREGYDKEVRNCFGSNKITGEKVPLGEEALQKIGISAYGDRDRLIKGQARLFPVTPTSSTSSSQGWVRDLTTECIEANPGPVYWPKIEARLTASETWKDEAELPRFTKWVTTLSKKGDARKVTTKTILENLQHYENTNPDDEDFIISLKQFIQEEEDKEAKAQEVPVQAVQAQIQGDPFNETLDTVRNWVRTKKPKAISTFKVAEGHPFYGEIASANIPMRMKSGKCLPDLLMHNLPQNPLEYLKRFSFTELDSKMDIDTPPLPATDDNLSTETKNLLELMNEEGNENRIIVLVGTSGCGKTRTLYETMCCYYGLYFTANVAGNGGSDDTKQFVKDAEFISGQQNEQKVVEKINERVFALLYSRLKLLDCCLEEWPEMTPYDWLLLQTVYFPLFKDGDPQTQLYRNAVLMRLIENKFLEELEFSLKKKGKRVFVALDEGQVFLRSCQGTFSSTTDTSKKRPLFAQLMRGLEHSTLQVLVAGTGLQLEDALEITASAVRKEVREMRRFVFSAFHGFYAPSQMRNYIRQIFPLSYETFFSERVFDVISGRYRFTSGFISKILCQSDPCSDGATLIRNALQEYQQEETPEQLPSREKIEVPKTIIEHLVKLEGLPSFQVYTGGFSLYEALYQLCTAYYLFGTKVLFPNPQLLVLVERGVCALARAGDEFSALISEPLAAKAISHYFSLKGRPVEMIPLTMIGLSQAVNPAICGFFIERYVIPAVIKYLCSSDTLMAHPYYKRHIDAKGRVPLWAESARVHLPHQKGNNQPLTLKKCSEDLSLVGYYNNPDCCDIYIPADLDRHDAVFQLWDSSNQRRLAIAQWRFVKNMTSKQVKDALKTTDYSISRKRKAGGDPVEVAEQNFAAGTGTLRIFFSFPFDPKDKDLPDCVRNQDVFLVCSQARTPDIFDDNIWAFLKAVKSKYEASGLFL